MDHTLLFATTQTQIQDAQTHVQDASFEIKNKECFTIEVSPKSTATKIL